MPCPNFNVNFFIRCYDPFHMDADILDNKNMYHMRYDAEKQDNLFSVLSNL